MSHAYGTTDGGKGGESSAPVPACRLLTLLAAAGPQLIPPPAVCTPCHILPGEGGQKRRETCRNIRGCEGAKDKDKKYLCYIFSKEYKHFLVEK